LGDASLRGNFVVQQVTNTLGQKRLTIAATGVDISLSSALQHVVSNAQGVLLILPDGIAGQLSGTVNLGSLLPAGIPLSGTFGVSINRTGAAATETVTVGGRQLLPDLPTGPYVPFSATTSTL